MFYGPPSLKTLAAKNIVSWFRCYVSPHNFPVQERLMLSHPSGFTARFVDYLNENVQCTDIRKYLEYEAKHCMISLRCRIMVNNFAKNLMYELENVNRFRPLHLPPWVQNIVSREFRQHHNLAKLERFLFCFSKPVLEDFIYRTLQQGIVHFIIHSPPNNLRPVPLKRRISHMFHYLPYYVCAVNMCLQYMMFLWNTNSVISQNEYYSAIVNATECVLDEYIVTLEKWLRKIWPNPCTLPTAGRIMGGFLCLDAFNEFCHENKRPMNAPWRNNRELLVDLVSCYNTLVLVMNYFPHAGVFYELIGNNQSLMKIRLYELTNCNWVTISSTYNSLVFEMLH
ncbi:ORF125 [Spodoptera frugiperda granulovirus]|uniref:ORF125 n=1 Tax=Spodoptera frugiperda granulovirus TaxID=307454 RepID=A0A0C5AQA6_9BBAC|nr:ORF125 [Spodoptera frugiperda granulovirus]AJK91786.1 ORF125 [Spodoptera frugiperda granulovirus]